ncbi:MAG: EscU/YscU/HrcU family type III secretion system export apparatus switch protein [Immundisolibacter sp.]|uniref:EscU/YscU/HrcU family type III secretion system export apparatus switch protein n=1 Tax=Immundisolibacter sp. TaxID=1934948 RepID=UPI003EE2E115
MAEESAQERTEKATPKRLEDSRKKGQVARSKELNSAALVLFGRRGIVAVRRSRQRWPAASDAQRTVVRPRGGA